MRTGPFLRPARQRAASDSSAVESGPPETARITRRKREKSEKRVESSLSAIGAPPPSAADTLLFRLDRRFDLRRGLRIFLQHGAERGAGGVLLAERRQRLAEPHQRLGRLRALRVLVVDVEEGFRRVVILLALE